MIHFLRQKKNQQTNKQLQRFTLNITNKKKEHTTNLIEITLKLHNEWKKMNKFASIVILVSFTHKHILLPVKIKK